MGVTKLDIEFEDDDEIAAKEEAAKKKDDGPEDVELQFDVEGAEAVNEMESTGSVDTAAPEESAPVKEESDSKKAIRAAREAKKKKAEDEAAAAATPAPVVEEVAVEEPAPVETVQPVAAAPAETIQEVQQPPTQAQPQVVQPQVQTVSIGAAYQLGDELRKAEVTNPILGIEIEAKIKVAVAEEMGTVKAEHAQATKVLEQKINRMINAIAAKAPAAKKELMQIKKLLAEHAEVRKKSGQTEGESTEPKKPASSSGAKPMMKKKVKKAA